MIPRSNCGFQTMLTPHVDGQQVVERHGLWNFTSTYTECRNYCSLAERSSL